MASDRTGIIYTTYLALEAVMGGFQSAQEINAACVLLSERFGITRERVRRIAANGKREEAQERMTEMPA